MTDMNDRGEWRNVETGSSLGKLISKQYSGFDHAALSCC